MSSSDATTVQPTTVGMAATNPSSKSPDQSNDEQATASKQMPSNAPTIATDETTSSSGTTTRTVEPRGKARARQLNMERFYRLSRRPELMNAFRKNKSAVMPKNGDGTEQMEVKEVNSRNMANLPPHVAALLNGTMLEKSGANHNIRSSSTSLPPKQEEDEATTVVSVPTKEEERDEGGEQHGKAVAGEHERLNWGWHFLNSGICQIAFSSSGVVKAAAKVVSTTGIRKLAIPTAPYIIDTMPEKMAKHRHEHLQANGEFSKDAEQTHVEVEEKKPQQEVVVKQ